MLSPNSPTPTRTMTWLRWMRILSMAFESWMVLVGLSTVTTVSGKASLLLLTGPVSPSKLDRDGMVQL